MERLLSSASFGVGDRTGSGASWWANLKSLTKARVGALLICLKADELSRRAQTAPTERSSALNEDRRSDVRKAVAATATTSAKCAKNSTLGVVAMYLMLPDMKASFLCRVSREETPSGGPGKG